MRIAPVSPVYPAVPLPRPSHRCADMALCPMTARQCAATATVYDVWSDPRVNGESKYSAR